jgi:hypothetical protein
VAAAEAKVTELEREHQDVLAADTLDHGQAETIEKKRDHARRERYHLLARRAARETARPVRQVIAGLRQNSKPGPCAGNASLDGKLADKIFGRNQTISACNPHS